MKENVLIYLRRAISLYNTLNMAYPKQGTQKVLEGAKHTIQRDIPRHVNNLFTILNMNGSNPPYPVVRTIEEAISVFEGEKIAQDIEIALSEDRYTGVDGSGVKRSGKEILNYSVDAIRSCVDLLQLQVLAVKL